MKMPDLNWRFHRFDSLDTHALFDLMKLRVDVFVVEQACAYPELDAHDKAPNTLHLLGYENEALIAYARAMPPVTQQCCLTEQPDETGVSGVSGVSGGDDRPSVQIGRVVVAKEHRGRGLAQSLMQQLIEYVQSNYPQHDQVLAAQTSVQTLYSALGFQPFSDIYLEDGIAHIDMRRSFAPLLIKC